MDDSKCPWSAPKKAISLLKSVLFFLFLILAISPPQAITSEDSVSVGGPVVPVNQPSSLVFIDAGVRGKQLLLSGMAADAKAVILRGDSDGIRQISTALQDYRHLDSIQIISHGAPGKLMLGGTRLTDGNLDRYRSELKTWGDSLRADGDILLFGCNVAQGAVGERFVERIGRFTGAAVAASKDATGPKVLGGNWDLEKQTGVIGAASAISNRAMSEYGRLLALPSNGLKDVTAAMVNPTPSTSLLTFVPGFTFTNNTSYNLAADTTPGADGFYILDSTYTSSVTDSFTINADGTNLATFDLTGIAVTNYPCGGPTTGAHYTITVTGIGGSSPSTSFAVDGQTIGTGNYSAFTGISGFQVSITGVYGSDGCGGIAYGAPSNITFDNYTIANATAPVTTPAVTGISPSSGPTAGGAGVTITGSGFTGTTSVTIGGASATSVVVVNDTTITATTPAGTVGAKDVVVTNSAGSGTGTGLYTYVAAPTVTGISPNYGSTAGGTNVTITGTNLTGATSVTIGGAAATSVVVVNPTTITATTPAGTAGAKDVVVTTAGGTGTGTSLFTYIAAPTVTGISPNSGPTAGSTNVTITGTSFTGTTSVTIGGAAATSVVVVNDTTITATTPAGAAGAQDVVVTNAVGSGTGTGLFTYIAAPTVTGISPSSGPTTGGTNVTITGSNFTGATSVTIGGASATSVVVVNPTTITATTPAGTVGAKDVAVTTVGGTGTGTGLFTYITVPDAPTSVVAAAGNTQATVTFTAPASDGGSAITTYTATSSPGGFTGTCAGPAACSITVSGLTNGTAYTFTVTATNAIGTSAASTASNSVTPSAVTVPDAPTGVTATAGYEEATINFTAPASDGGSAITTYTATSSPGGFTGTCAGPDACAITVTGLTGGTAYTFTVTATNAIGTGAASAPSNSVTVSAVRPDPTKDADVVGLVNAQVETANRFWRTQTSNYHRHLESLHRAARNDGTAANSLTADSGAPALTTDSESFTGVSRSLNAVGKDRLVLASEATQTDAGDVGSDWFSTGVISEVVSVLTTSSFNLNLGAFGDAAGPTAGNDGEVDIWAAGNVRIGKRKAQDGGAKIEYTTDGITLGADRWFGENLVLGIGIGYAHDKSEIGSSGTEHTADGNSIAVYGSYQPGVSVFVDGVLGYGVLDLDSSRYDTTAAATARADRNGDQVFGSLAIGYEYFDEATYVSPYARYDIAESRLDSATETGAGASSLYYAGQTYTSQQISLGLRAGFRHDAGFYTLLPRARIEYQHHIEGGDDASIAYADTLSSRYSMAMPTENADSLLLGVGSGFVLRNGLNIDIDYQWVHSTDEDDSQAIFLRLSKPLGGN